MAEPIDTRAQVSEFLATRRARLTPEQVGLPATGRRRVPGLRREEVAVLAGVSTDWYIRLERGHITEVSEDVLAAVARALRLDEAERSHLDDLALCAPVYDVADGGRVNTTRFQVLDPASGDFHGDREAALDTSVATMRTAAGRDAGDRALTDLVGELATRSEEFRRRWAGHDVRLHHTGAKTSVHPAVGRLDVAFEAVDLPTDDLWGLDLTVCTGEPGSPAADALALLASWAATPRTTACLPPRPPAPVRGPHGDRADPLEEPRTCHARSPPRRAPPSGSPVTSSWTSSCATPSRPPSG